MLEFLLGSAPTIDPPPDPGQIQWTAAGTYSWVVPAGLRSICALVVAPGTPGYCADVNYMGIRWRGYGGYGGQLDYRNNIAVTPGETLTITVGSGGTTDTGSNATKRLAAGTTILKWSKGSISLSGTGSGGSAGYSNDNQYIYGGNSGNLTTKTGTMKGSSSGIDIRTGKSTSNGYTGGTSGGGGAAGVINGTNYRYKGGDGGVRIIWGDGRSYPGTLITDL